MATYQIRIVPIVHQFQASSTDSFFVPFKRILCCLPQQLAQMRSSKKCCARNPWTLYERFFGFIGMRTEGSWTFSDRLDRDEAVPLEYKRLKTSPSMLEVLVALLGRGFWLHTLRIDGLFAGSLFSRVKMLLGMTSAISFRFFEEAVLAL